MIKINQNDSRTGIVTNQRTSLPNKGTLTKSEIATYYYFFLLSTNYFYYHQIRTVKPLYKLKDFLAN